MCVQSLRCLKLKYPSFFSARWVSRHLGRDVSHDVSSLIEEALVSPHLTANILDDTEA